MEDGNAEFWFAFRAYHDNGMLPSVFSSLPRREKLMLVAFMDIKAEQEKKEERKYKN